MAAKKPLHWLVTANYTGDGAVAYMCADHSWTGSAKQAAIFETKDAAEVARKVGAGMESVVADPYLIEVVLEAGELDLLTARERIRAGGPTVRVRRPDPRATR